MLLGVDERMHLQPQDMRPTYRRTRHNRMLATALPCALVAAIVIAFFFTVGHAGFNARRGGAHQAEVSNRPTQSTSLLQLAGIAGAADVAAASVREQSSRQQWEAPTTADSRGQAARPTREREGPLPPDGAALLHPRL